VARPPPSAEVMNEWRYTFNPPYVFMAWRLLKHKDNFTFTLSIGLLQQLHYHGIDHVAGTVRMLIFLHLRLSLLTIHMEQSP
jgi:hypothetical protein